MTTTLQLGAIQFQSFELPERISWGGSQGLSVHRLPGGVRVIDAMGRDDAQITWAGTFTGPDAADRARAMDLNRTYGAVLPLIWDSFYYSVVVSTFSVSYKQANWIPYRIACTVLRDEAEALVEVAISLAAAGLADLASASAAGGNMEFSESAAALDAPGAATLGTVAYGIALGSLDNALSGVQKSVAASGNQLAANIISNATDLQQAVGMAGQLASAVNAQGFVQRARANLRNAST